jgi:hypothetical protein
MVGHHIPTAARDKILREIAMRAQGQVLALEYNMCVSFFLFSSSLLRFSRPKLANTNMDTGANK